jgi:L-lysine exporter family protein LysE/ArgO
MTVYISGLLLGFSLIMALGPQNIFLIRQGVMRRHAFLSALTCFSCDVILITLSVTGLHHILERYPKVGIALAYFGGAFLLYYGVSSLLRGLKAAEDPLSHQTNIKSRRQIIGLAVGFSLLNPHAIIDSLVLIGGGSSQFPDHPNIYLMGVLTSSFAWFASLTFIAYYFSDILTKGHIWRRVEQISGVLMIYLAIKLAVF